MRSILTITGVADSQDLTTIDTVKVELGITNASQDTKIETLIHQASGIAADYCRRVFGSEDVTQTFWPQGGSEWLEYLVLDRDPVTEIATVTVDDVEDTYYRLDADAGLLYKLDSSGYPCRWIVCKSAVVAYTAGYELLGTLPYAIERATILLVKEMWAAIGRDPRVKAEDVPNLGRLEYWIGQMGHEGDLSPDVVTLLAPYRRPSI